MFDGVPKLTPAAVGSLARPACLRPAAQNLRSCEATKREVSLWKPRLRQMSSRAAASDAEEEEGAELQRLVENLSTEEVGNAGVKDMLHQMIIRSADKTDPAVSDRIRTTSGRSALSRDRLLPRISRCGGGAGDHML